MVIDEGASSISSPVANDDTLKMRLARNILKCNDLEIIGLEDVVETVSSSCLKC